MRWVYVLSIATNLGYGLLISVSRNGQGMIVDSLMSVQELQSKGTSMYALEALQRLSNRFVALAHVDSRGTYAPCWLHPPLP